MEPEGSLSCWQELATEVYRVPDESSPQSHIVSLRSSLKKSSHMRLSLLSGLFPSDFSDQNFAFTYLSHACYMSRPSNLYILLESPNGNYQGSLWYCIHQFVFVHPYLLSHKKTSINTLPMQYIPS
jgi:hypothetical protein